jgi:crotonobetainyl-CoA:carnitine CoA-transferase CaiB-like acyl-CoA transferase
MGKQLEGIRVVELGTMITGPLAGQLLADLGADVIKVENPDGGDPFRSFRGGLYSAHFTAYNRNKRSITIDIRSSAGRDLVLMLAAHADVFIENFRPGVIERLNLSHDALRAANPRLIYCAISGFGQDGPYSSRPAYDGVAQSLSGILSLFIQNERPQPTGPTLSDNLTGYYACYGILGALVERARTGRGCRVDVNMLESTIALMGDPVASYTQYAVESGPLTRVSISQSYAARCEDGKLIALHLSSQQKFWDSLLVAIAKPELANDLRFNSRDKRIQNYEALRDELMTIFATRPRNYWLKRLEENDVPHAPVLTVSEIFDDPQIRHLKTFFEVSHPHAGKVQGIRSPVRYDGQRDEEIKPPPVLGEHTDEILAGIGYDSTTIAALRRDRIV